MWARCAVCNSFGYAILASVVSASCSQPTQPLREGAEYRITVPTARQESKLTHTFELTNLEGHPVQILRTTSTCGCTTVDNIVGRTIENGAKIDVPVTVDLAGKQGRYQAAVGLYLVDATLPVLLQIEGDVYREHPSKIEFGEIRQGEPVRQRFVLRPFPGQRNVQVKDCKYASDYFAVSMEAHDFIRGAMVVTVTLVESIPYGKFDFPIVLTTNDTEVPDKVVTASGYVLRPLEIVPTELNFGMLNSDESAEGAVDLYSPYGQAIEMLQVDNSLDRVFSWSIDRSEVAIDRVRFRIATTGKYPEGVRPGSVVRGVFWFHARVAKEIQKARLEVYGSI
ncbi:MAG: hypothetical protein AMXMBFR4_06920 [Candidatus Hydrogenedentota bacterium]